MPRQPRHDHPGAWHHIYVRGIARRTVLERARDSRVLRYLLAREVRRGTIEVHAYCFLTTHVHLLVRSPTGQLSAAMRRILNAYVRWFNRSRKRDGALFRGRFGSRKVTTHLDRLNVIAYIDANPVQAGLTDTPEDFGHGSAGFWRHGRAPRWFATWFVAQVLGVEGPGGAGAWDAYTRVLRPRGTEACKRLIEARLLRRDAQPDPLDDLLGAATPQVAAWMVRKAKLADQTRPGLPVVDATTVDAAWRAARSQLPGVVRGRRGAGCPRALLARTALLRDLAGLCYQEIAARLPCSPSSARKRYLTHAEQVARDPDYAAKVAAIAHAALCAAHPPLPPPRG